MQKRPYAAEDDTTTTQIAPPAAGQGAEDDEMTDEWSVKNQLDGTRQIVAGGWPFATVHYDYRYTCNMQTYLRANLIAAAPDLRDALTAMVEMQEKMSRSPRNGGGVLPADYGIVCGKAHAALAKARGEDPTTP